MVCYDTYINKTGLTMKCDVRLFVAGTVFTETVQARDYQEARQVALARNPNARVVGVNASFK